MLNLHFKEPQRNAEESNESLWMVGDGTEDLVQEAPQILSVQGSGWTKRKKSFLRILYYVLIFRGVGDLSLYYMYGLKKQAKIFF
jgi:hypothetical protein